MFSHRKPHKYPKVIQKQIKNNSVVKETNKILKSKSYMDDSLNINHSWDAQKLKNTVRDMIKKRHIRSKNNRGN